MTIYILSDEHLNKYKNKYGDNVCGANTLDFLGFEESVIKELLKYRDIDFEWEDMLDIIINDDSKIKQKKWIKDKTNTIISILPYNKRDKNMNRIHIEFVAEELLNGTYKIIGISGENDGYNWGHYMVIGKNNDGELLSFDPKTGILIKGIDNIIEDFNEDDIKYIINYFNGLVVNHIIESGNMSKKKKQRKKKKKQRTKKKKQRTKKKNNGLKRKKT